MRKPMKSRITESLTRMQTVLLDVLRQLGAATNQEVDDGDRDVLFFGVGIWGAPLGVWRRPPLADSASLEVPASEDEEALIARLLLAIDQFRLDPRLPLITELEFELTHFTRAAGRSTYPLPTGRPSVDRAARAAP